jgi:hypothetical protein
MPYKESTPRHGAIGANAMRKKTLWQIREWGAWPHVYSTPLGRKLRSAARCDKLVKRLARDGRLFYVAPLIIHY